MYLDYAQQFKKIMKENKIKKKTFTNSEIEIKTNNNTFYKTFYNKGIKDISQNENIFAKTDKIFSLKNYLQYERNNENNYLNKQNIITPLANRSNSTRSQNITQKKTFYKSSSNFNNLNITSSTNFRSVNNNEEKENNIMEEFRKQTKIQKIERAAILRQKSEIILNNERIKKLDEKTEKIVKLQKKIEKENYIQKELDQEIEDKRMLKIKLHNILKNDTFFRCKEYETKNEAFNRKIFNYLESEYLTKLLTNYHKSFRHEKNEPGTAHNPKKMLIDLEVAHLNKISPQMLVESKLTKNEIEQIINEPDYFVKNIDYTSHVKFFNPTSLVEKFKTEDENKLKRKKTTMPIKIVKLDDKLKQKINNSKLTNKVTKLENKMQNYLMNTIVKKNNSDKQIEEEKEKIRNSLVGLVDKNRAEFYNKKLKKTMRNSNINFDRKIGVSELRQTMILRSIKNNQNSMKVLEKNKIIKKELENEKEMFNQYLSKIKENLINANHKKKENLIKNKNDTLSNNILNEINFINTVGSI